MRCGSGDVLLFVVCLLFYFNIFLQAWISETVVGDFQDDFLIDLESGLPT
jgi:hypothetical protein